MASVLQDPGLDSDSSDEDVPSPMPSPLSSPNTSPKAKRTTGVPVKRSALGLMPPPVPKKRQVRELPVNNQLAATPSTSSQARKFTFKPVQIEDEFITDDEDIQTQEPQKIVVAPGPSPLITEVSQMENKENCISMNAKPLEMLLFALNNEQKLQDKRTDLYNKILEKLN